MSAGCKSCVDDNKSPSANQRFVLWVALILNGSMFFVEIFASFLADSVALKADAIDFFGDSANYGVSLFVLGMSLRARSIASLLKAFTMGIFGVWVIMAAFYNSIYISSPEPKTMGSVGILAMIVNLVVAGLLYKFRNGDSNMRSVWLCTRNDVIGNIAVVAAAGGILISSSRWPDLAVALGMGGLALHSSLEILKAARSELSYNLHSL